MRLLFNRNRRIFMQNSVFEENSRISAPKITPPHMETMQRTAEIFGVSYYFVRKMALSGKINAVRISGRILINCDKFADFLNNATLPALEEQPEPSKGIRDLSTSPIHYNAGKAV